MPAKWTNVEDSTDDDYCHRICTAHKNCVWCNLQWSEFFLCFPTSHLVLLYWAWKSYIGGRFTLVWCDDAVIYTFFCPHRALRLWVLRRNDSPPDVFRFVVFLSIFVVGRGEKVSRETREYGKTGSLLLCKSLHTSMSNIKSVAFYIFHHAHDHDHPHQPLTWRTRMNTNNNKKKEKKKRSACHHRAKRTCKKHDF